MKQKPLFVSKYYIAYYLSQFLLITVLQLSMCVPQLWKFQDFSAIHIFREINFAQSRTSKTAVCAIFGALSELC